MRTRKNCLVIPALALATFNLARSGRSNSRHLVRAFLRSFLVSKCVTFFTVLFRRCTAFTPERLPRLPRASAFLCRSNSYLAHNEFPKITILAISIRLSLAPCRDSPCNSIVLKKFDMPQWGTTSCLSKKSPFPGSTFLRRMLKKPRSEETDTWTHQEAKREGSPPKYHSP